MKNLLLLIALFYCFKIGSAQPGTLDASFGKKGVVRADLGTAIAYSSAGKQVLLLPDGSMYIVFESSGVTFITKKHPDGSADSAYGQAGFSVSVTIQNSHAALQRDGKIIVAGNVAGEYYSGDGRDIQGPSNQNFAVARFGTNGSLDHTFNRNGKAITDFIGYDDFINSIVIQSDGKIVVQGYTSIYDTNLAYDTANETYYYPKISDNLSLARYNSNGSLDNSFDADGRLLTQLQINSSNPNSVAIQTDGKIVVTGSDNNRLTLARYNADGSADSTFNVTNDLTRPDSSYFTPRSLAIQSDGKIVLGGFWGNSKSNTDFVIARFTTGGSLDKTFDTDGIQTTDFRTYNDVINSIVIQTDGKIVAAGSASNGKNDAFAIARYNTNGSPDNTFDTDGKKMNFITSNNVYAASLAVGGDGKLVAAGYEQSPAKTNIAITRYNANGSLDNTFHRSGTLVENFKEKNTVFTNNAVQKDGKVVVAGYARNGTGYDNIVARYNADGSADTSFSSDGILVTVTNANPFTSKVALQADGKIMAAAGSLLLRYNIDGSLDKTFSEDGKQTASFEISVLKIQANGKIVAAGGTTIARYTYNGSLDNSFNGTGIVNNYYAVKDLAFQSDGKIVVEVDDNDDLAAIVVRYNTDGSADPTFHWEYPNWENEGGGTDYFDSYSSSLTIQKDGKIIATGYGGYSDKYSLSYNTLVARFNPDGSLDKTFSEDGKDIPLGNSYSALVALQDDGKIIVASDLYQNTMYGYGYYDEVPAGFGIIRYNNSGTPDSSFGMNRNGKIVSQQDEIIRMQSIVIANNKLYAAGNGEVRPVGKGRDGRIVTNFGFLARFNLAANKAPIVKITSPANNTAFTAPANITVNAAASDADGTMYSVKFYNGTTYLKTDFASPYSYTIVNLAAGTYSITAKATDNTGAQTISAAVTVVVKAPNQAPSVTITSPANNAAYAAPASITVNVLAADADGTIQSVKFYNGTTYLKTDFTSPYSYTIANLPAGTYSITAKATDNNGAQTISAPVTVKMTNAAIVSNKPYSENKKTAQNDALRLRLSPNPASNIVNVSTTGLQPTKPATLSIISTSGNVLKTINISNSTMQLDVSSLSKGVYTIKIVSGDKVIYKQFVKL